MGLFDMLFHRPNLEEGLQQWKATPGAVLLDVRTPAEYRDGHIPGAVNRPLDRLQVEDLPKEAPLFAYCLSGARSAQACQLLRRQGREAVNIGGIGGYRGTLER